MKIKIVIFILFIICCSCSSLFKFGKPCPKGNENYVKEIIENHENLYRFLNDTNISNKFLIKDLNNIINDLHEHIVNNKFQYGYKIEYIDTVRKISVPFSDSFYYKHAIKIRSNFNEDIIWFGFTFDGFTNKWKIREFWYCNNPVEMIHYDKPCDKK